MTSPQSAVTIIASQPLVPVSELLRVRCDSCYQEVGMTGRREHMQTLLEREGWHLGKTILCPTCSKKRAQKELRNLTAGNFQDSTSDLD